MGAARLGRDPDEPPAATANAGSPASRSSPLDPSVSPSQAVITVVSSAHATQSRTCPFGSRSW